MHRSLNGIFLLPPTFPVPISVFKYKTKRKQKKEIAKFFRVVWFPRKFVGNDSINETC